MLSEPRIECGRADQQGGGIGAGGAGLLEFLRRAAWIGVAAGLEAEGPVGPGVDGAAESSPIESTADPENTSNSPMSDLYKLSWPFATGRIMTTCTSGLQSVFTQTGQTTAAWKWH